MKLTSKLKLGGNKCNQAVDWDGNTIDFMHSALAPIDEQPNGFWAKHDLAIHTQKPRVINVDKNAAYPIAVEDLKAEEILTQQALLAK